MYFHTLQEDLVPVFVASDVGLLAEHVFFCLQKQEQLDLLFQQVVIAHSLLEDDVWYTMNALRHINMVKLLLLSLKLQ